MKPITQEWINKAEGNYSSAQVLLSQPEPNADLICFLSQQWSYNYFWCTA